MSIVDQKYNTGSPICPLCNKPYSYYGDVPAGGFPKGFEPYCTCDQTDYTFTFPTPFKQIGWICPVCGRGVNPNLTSCPCNNEPHNLTT